jgi:hypothetical protein
MMDTHRHFRKGKRLLQPEEAILQGEFCEKGIEARTPIAYGPVVEAILNAACGVTNERICAHAATPSAAF